MNQPDEPQEIALEYLPTWKDRLAGWLFPHHGKAFEYPDWARSGIPARIAVRLSFASRLRVLFGGVVVTDIRVHTDRLMHQSDVQAFSYVRAPWDQS